MATRIQDVGTAGADLFGAAFADRHHRRCSVAEQCPRDERGDIRIGLLRKRAKLYRDQDRDVVGRTAQIVVQPSHPRGSGDATQPEYWHPPHVGPQAQLRGDAGVQRRHRNAGDRRRDDEVDVARE